jgi:ubiquinone/menaquinone biosynthesis C-methylase UbiE
MMRADRNHEAPVTAKQRTHKLEKLARIYDQEILPIWSQRFGRMMLRDLAVPAGGQVLDVACATGYPAVEILRRMDERARLIAIDGSSSMLEVAREKVKLLAEEGVKAKAFFRTEHAAPRLSFADGVYDLVVCNLGLMEMPDPGAALIDFARVTKPGGQVRCTLPLDGTFEEFFDIYREVLIKHDKHDALDRLADHTSIYPSPGTCEYWLRSAGLTDIRVEVEEFSMLFKSSREFFFAPVIECGPLAAWKAAAGSGQEMQDVFWYIKEAIDAYFTGRAFEVTVKAGCLTGTVPVEAEQRAAVADAEAEAGEPMDDDLIELSTEDIDVEELGAADIVTLDGADRVYRVDDDDVVIEAFVEGSQRPPHLDDD